MTSLAATPPASATGVGTLTFEWCGTSTACATGLAVNADTWELSIDIVACTATGCGSSSSVHQITPLALQYLVAEPIPSNAFSACATLTGPIGGPLHDCL